MTGGQHLPADLVAAIKEHLEIEDVVADARKASGEDRTPDQAYLRDIAISLRLLLEASTVGGET